jgi:hypothetical protein
VARVYAAVLAGEVQPEYAPGTANYLHCAQTGAQREEVMKCLWCDGEGSWVEEISYELGGPTYYCDACNGEGEVTFFTWLKQAYHYYFNQHFIVWWAENISDDHGPWTIRKLFAHWRES